MTRWVGHTKRKFLRVTALPTVPRSRGRYWIETSQRELDYTHLLFRYPAKFYRPIVRWALKNHANRTHTVIDPFAGSGTLNIEALLSGRPSVGIDLDPLACFVAKAKTTPLDPDRLDKSLERIKKQATIIARKESDLERLIGSDISRDVYNKNKKKFWVPEIPNIEHWFKRHVIVDLSALLHLLKDEVRLEKADRHFFLACYAAIIRRVSNADPTPVSGLEVTSIQAKRNETREINVVEEFLRKSRLAIHGMRELWSATHAKKRHVPCEILCGDARDIESTVVDHAPELLPFSLAITSPPYCNAVEYGRRHKLEMYWLDLIPETSSHVALSRSYIGYRNLVGRRTNRLREFGISKLDRVLKRIDESSFARAISLERYFSAMERFFYELARVTQKNADVICVIGNSTCAEVEVPTSMIVTDLASDQFYLKSTFSYAIQNHHMQYGLRNGNGIREEMVLSFRRR
jgi:DNA modification methylase